MLFCFDPLGFCVGNIRPQLPLSQAHFSNDTNYLLRLHNSMFLAVSDVYTKIWKSSRLRKDALIVARLLLLLPNFLCQPWSCAFFSFSLLLLFSIWSYIGNTLATDCHTTTMVFLIFVVLASFYFDLSSRLNVLYSFYYTHRPWWCSLSSVKVIHGVATTFFCWFAFRLAS